MIKFGYYGKEFLYPSYFLLTHRHLLEAVLFTFVLFGRIYELKNEEKAKENIEATNLSTFARVVVGLIYLALLILLLFLLNI